MNPDRFRVAFFPTSCCFRKRDDGCLALKADLEGAIKVVFLIVGKMAEDRGLSKYQARLPPCLPASLCSRLSP